MPLGSHRWKDLTGKRFGRLTARWPVGKNRSGEVCWLTSCVCGALRFSPSSELRRKRSCGCFDREQKLKHGHARKGKVTVEYLTWQMMKSRCTNRKNISYKNYGGRGIRVCQRWARSFSAFFADMGRRPSVAHSLDRFPNNNGDYRPDNCRWATRKQQQANRRKPR